VTLLDLESLQNSEVSSTNRSESENLKLERNKFDKRALMQLRNIKI